MLCVLILDMSCMPDALYLWSRILSDLHADSVPLL